MAHIQDLLARIGLEPERARMVNMSAAMASAFAEAAQHMTEHIRALGPNPLRASPPAQTDTERGE